MNNLGLLLLLWAIPSGAEKAAPPDETASTKIRAVVKELYGAEWANAKSPQQKQALAKKVHAKARESTSAGERYILLEFAQRVAAMAGDVNTTFAVMSDVTSEFNVDTAQYKTAAIATLVTSVTAADDHKLLVPKILSLADDAAARTDFSQARKYLELALQDARKAKDAGLLKSANACKNRVEAVAKGFEAIKPALETLQNIPDDPAANRAVGEFYCFVLGNWEKGGSMLALGSDAALREIAASDLKGGTSVEERTKLGDAWWEYSERHATVKNQVQARAAYWYREALPELKGLERERVVRRLAQVAPTDSRDMVLRYDWGKTLQDWTWSGRNQPKANNDGFLAIEDESHGKLKFTRNDIQITGVSLTLESQRDFQAVVIDIGDNKYRIHFFERFVSIFDEKSEKVAMMLKGRVNVEILLPPEGDTTMIVNNVKLRGKAKPAGELMITVDQPQPVLIGSISVKGIAK